MSNILPSDDGIIINPSAETIRNYYFWQRFYGKLVRGDIIQLPPPRSLIIGVYYSHYTSLGRLHMILAYDWKGRVRAKDFDFKKFRWEEMKLLVKREDIEGQTLISSIEYFKEHYPEERSKFY